MYVAFHNMHGRFIQAIISTLKLSDVTEMGELLQELDIVLRKVNNRNYLKLQAPLSESELDIMFGRLNIQDPDLRKFYQWKNGFNVRSGLGVLDQIFDFGVPMPLDVLMNSIDQGFRDNKNLIGIVGDCSGDFLLYNRQIGDDFGKIHIESTSLLFIDNNPVIYDSVLKLVETTLAAYKEGALYFLDNKPFLEQDLDKYGKIARVINKHSDFWFL